MVNTLYAPFLAEQFSYALPVLEIVGKYLLELDAKISVDAGLLQFRKVNRIIPCPSLNP